MNPVPDPILPEKFLLYSLESNPVPLGWQSDVLTAISIRWCIYIYIYIYIFNPWRATAPKSLYRLERLLPGDSVGRPVASEAPCAPPLGSEP